MLLSIQEQSEVSSLIIQLKAAGSLLEWVGCATSLEFTVETYAYVSTGSDYVMDTYIHAYMISMVSCHVVHFSKAVLIERLNLLFQASAGQAVLRATAKLKDRKFFCIDFYLFVVSVQIWRMYIYLYTQCYV